MCQPNPTLGGLTHDILQCHLFLSHEATRPLPLMDMVDMDNDNKDNDKEDNDNENDG